MPPRTKISQADGLAALAAWRHAGQQTPRPALATAVRFTLQIFAEEHPGGAVELRVPPFAAVQCIPGTSHTRGTPPAVVEMDAHAWLRLSSGTLTWADGTGPGGPISASGERSNLSAYLPLAIARRAALSE